MPTRSVVKFDNIVLRIDFDILICLSCMNLKLGILHSNNIKFGYNQILNGQILICKKFDSLYYIDDSQQSYFP